MKTYAPHGCLEASTPGRKQIQSCTMKPHSSPGSGFRVPDALRRQRAEQHQSLRIRNHHHAVGHWPEAAKHRGLLGGWRAYLAVRKWHTKAVSGATGKHPTCKADARNRVSPSWPTANGLRRNAAIPVLSGIIPHPVLHQATAFAPAPQKRGYTGLEPFQGSTRIKLRKDRETYEKIQGGMSR